MKLIKQSIVALLAGVLVVGQVNFKPMTVMAKTFSVEAIQEKEDMRSDFDTLWRPISVYDSVWKQNEKNEIIAPVTDRDEILLRNDIRTSKGVVEADILVGSSSGQMQGFIIGHGGQNTAEAKQQAYIIILDGNNIKIHQSGKGDLAIATHEADVGEWISLKVSFTSNDIKVYVNGQLKISYSTQVVIKPQTSIGLFTTIWPYNEEAIAPRYRNFEFESEEGEGDATEIYNITSTNLKLGMIFKSQDGLTYTMPISQYDKNITNAQLTIAVPSGATTNIDPNKRYDLTESLTVVVTNKEQSKEYTINPIVTSNSVLPGIGNEIIARAADPETICYEGKYYIYTTYDAWDGEQKSFNVFESADLVTWEDKGNAFHVDWNKNDFANYALWAPAVEQGRDGKFYLYFTAKPRLNEGHNSSIGVAVADTPLGPFKTVYDEPIVSLEEYEEMFGKNQGQAIDADVFTDEDGSVYMYLGNYSLMARKMNSDMVSFEEGSEWRDMTESIGRKYGKEGDFCEGMTVFRRQGKYYFTWSSNGTFEPNYMAKWGVADSPLGEIEYKGVLIERQPELGINAPGHHSILNIPGTDEWYIIYHRWSTTGGAREVCIDKMDFDEEGNIIQVIPTLEGIREPVVKPEVSSNKITIQALESVQAGETIEVRLGLETGDSPVYAQDFILNYNSNAFDLVKYEVLEQTLLAGVEERELGNLRFVLATQNGLTSGQKSINVIFQANEVKEELEESMGISDALFGLVENGNAIAQVAKGEERKIIILPSDGTVPGEDEADVNKDGVVDVADMALIAYYYAYTNENEGWEIAKQVDVNKDGRINVEDLAIVATFILEVQVK